MSGFNLLPWREERRRECRRQFHSLLGLAMVLGAVMLLAGFVLNQRSLAQQSERRQMLEREIASLDARIGEVRKLREAIAALTARRDAVQRLQQVRTAPVRFLDELTARVPQGVMLKSVQQAARLTLSGYAQSSARVSDLLRALAGAVSVRQPELLEIKAATLGQGRDARRVVEFTIALDASGLAQEVR